MKLKIQLIFLFYRTVLLYYITVVEKYNIGEYAKRSPVFGSVENLSVPLRQTEKSRPICGHESLSGQKEAGAERRLNNNTSVIRINRALKIIFYSPLF